MPLLGGETQLKNTSMSVLLLPKGSRVPTSHTLTLATAADEGDASISLTSSGASELKAGAAYSFVDGSGNRYQAVVETDTTITGTTSVPVLELVASIPVSATATHYVGLVPVLGLQDFSVQSNDQEVDTTNTLSGIGTEIALVRSGKVVNCSGIQIPGDEGLFQVIKPVALTASTFGREIYAVLAYPDGETFQGVAKVRNFSQPGNQNEVKKFSFELTFMGTTFQYLSPIAVA